MSENSDELGELNPYEEDEAGEMLIAKTIRRGGNRAENEKTCMTATGSTECLWHHNDGNGKTIKEPYALQSGKARFLPDHNPAFEIGE